MIFFFFFISHFFLENIWIRNQLSTKICFIYIYFKIIKVDIKKKKSLIFIKKKKKIVISPPLKNINREDWFKWELL